MKRNRVPMLVLDPVRESLVSSAGGVLLGQTIAVSGLDRSLSAAVSPWGSPRAVHDPGKVLLDVATAVALGGDCLADVAVVRAQPEVVGSVASDPTVSPPWSPPWPATSMPRWQRSAPHAQLLASGSGPAVVLWPGSRVGR